MAIGPGKLKAKVNAGHIVEYVIIDNTISILSVDGTEIDNWLTSLLVQTWLDMIDELLKKHDLN